MGEVNPLYLVKVEAGANNNKFYRMIPNGSIFDVQFGRIGNSGFQTTSYPMGKWDSTLKSKLKKGYEDQSRLVADTIVKEKKSKEYLDIQNQVIASIVSRLQSMARQAIADNYTISSNKVTQVMIDEAQLTLNNLMSADTIELFNKILVELFKIIPRKMKKVKDNLAKDTKDFGEIIQKEQDLLDVMRGQVVAESIIKDEEDVDINEPINNQTILDVMGLQFEEINDKEKTMIKKELGEISDRFYQAWKVINIRTQEKFDKFITNEKIKDSRLLFHGSRSENFWSIINSGLVLRPTGVVINGKMFGNGCYFSPTARKSLGYTSISGSRWVSGNANSGFMALFDVAYGKPYNVHSFDSKYYNFNYEELQKVCKGANSLHAHKGQMLYNDEIIVYKEDQMTIKYLIELK